MQYINKGLAQMRIKKIDRTTRENGNPSLLMRGGNYPDVIFQGIFRKFETKREETTFLHVREQKVLSHAEHLKTELRTLCGEIYNETEEPSPLVGLLKKTSAMEDHLSDIDFGRTQTGACSA